MQRYNPKSGSNPKKRCRGATRGEFNYGSNAPLRSWAFPPLALCIKTAIANQQSY
ncbi:hypothetical protein [Moorena sp. SIO4G3]|uniref:hypothetical protein n=1 Tax=Moorena sp. SIO4G3 TaxID=2607821 RepID=UPI00142ADC85|nr:hypothetical protein [Moorena sp. SIO4G3]NEO76107.1 hypothetical protein [Moorena sp. SIO4G3]